MEAIAKASAYLNIKPRTRMQTVKYLRGKGYSEDEIEEAVSMLEEYGYIDDLNYAVLFFELGFEKKHGIARIRHELVDRGVEKEIIETAFQKLENVPDQYDEALDIAKGVAEKYDIENMTYEEKYKLKAKIARRLATKGFSGDVVYRAVRECVK